MMSSCSEIIVSNTNSGSYPFTLSFEIGTHLARSTQGRHKRLIRRPQQKASIIKGLFPHQLRLTPQSSVSLRFGYPIPQHLSKYSPSSNHHKYWYSYSNNIPWVLRESSVVGSHSQSPLSTLWYVLFPSINRSSLSLLKCLCFIDQVLSYCIANEMLMIVLCFDRLSGMLPKNLVFNPVGTFSYFLLSLLTMYLRCIHYRPNYSP